MNGATYQEMAKRFGVSYQYLRELMQAKKPVERMSLEFLFKLFPKATINLHGDAVAVHASGTNGNVVGVNRGAVDGDWVQSAMQKILETEDLSDSEKIKVLKALQR